MSLDLASRRDAALRIIEKASVEALRFFGERERLAVETKGPRDFVTDADRAIETMVREKLAALFPDDAVLGEEEGGTETDRYWIVDPIDGTSNFLAGSPLWGLSLGYVVDGEPVVGAIAAPVLGETLVAARGEGVLRNRQPFARHVVVPGLGLVSVGDSPGEELEPHLALQGRLRAKRWVVEAFHSTSVSMLFAALGRFDGHIQPVTTMWDIAGGACVCRELGLHVDIRRSLSGHYGVFAGTRDLLADAGDWWTGDTDLRRAAE